MRQSCGSIRIHSEIFRPTAFLLSIMLLPLATAEAVTPLVQDDAGMMSAAQRTKLSEHHRLLRKDHDIDYRVVTHNRTGDINRYAVERFERLAVGKSSRTARGLLLVIDPAQSLVRLEVGYSLEGVFPDAFVAYIEKRQMVPFFRAGRVADGILATTELIVTRAQRAKAKAGFETEAWFIGSGGGGATARVDEANGRPEKTHDPKVNIAPGRTPAETLTSYFKAMQARNASSDLDLYTPATRRMLERWVMTPAQMDNVLRTYRHCRPEPTRTDGDRAVIRYPIRQRTCAPFFFERIDGAWALDLTMMQRVVRFGRDNAWRFDRRADHPYAFAFRDWRFDRNGFPKSQR